MADSEVWNALRAGDPDALTALLDQHGKAVYNFAFRRTSSWSTAEDVLQATFTTIWRRAAEGRLDELTRDSAQPYLVTVAGYEAANLTRSTNRWMASFRRSETPLVEADHADDVVDRLEEEQQMRLLRRALSKLPRGQREALELVVWADMSMADAASALGVAEGTVKSRVSRGRDALRRQVSIELGKEGWA